jgi:hypothetical protein
MVKVSTAIQQRKGKSMKYKVPIITAITALGMAVASHAAQINGNITFAGGVQLDTGSAATATQVTAWHGPGGVGDPIVISSSGDFAIVLPLTSVAFTAPYSFVSGPHPALWSVPAVGGFVFDLISSGITSQGTSPEGEGFVTASGMGTITHPLFDPTPGTWSFSTQDPSAANGGPAIFSFSASTHARPQVPDGGSTLMLLGAGFAAMGFFARRFRKA